MVRCYEIPAAQADKLYELHRASKERRRIISKARHGRISMNVEERRALPYVCTRRVYTPAMKANLLLVAYGSLTDFSRRVARICEIARQTSIPLMSVITLLTRFQGLGHDVERFI